VKNTLEQVYHILLNIRRPNSIKHGRLKKGVVPADTYMDTRPAQRNISNPNWTLQNLLFLCYASCPCSIAPYLEKKYPSHQFKPKLKDQHKSPKKY